MTGNCEAAGCAKKKYCKGWCRTHYDRMLRLGRLDLPPAPSAEERFWVKVDKSGDCWDWTAHTTQGGYGVFGADGRRLEYAHRYSFMLASGPIQKGQVIDHMCYNRKCVNPAHLRCVTQSENGLNRSGPKSGSKSGVLGVSWDSSRQKWQASVAVMGRTVSAGRHETIAGAERAVKKLREDLGVVVTGTGRRG